jgi:hypothetical protein
VATSRVIHEDLTGFSRHYAGADGACIGFALLELYDVRIKRENRSSPIEQPT